MFAKRGETDYHPALDGIERKTLVHGDKTLITEFRLHKGSVLRGVSGFRLALRNTKRTLSENGAGAGRFKIFTPDPGRGERSTDRSCSIEGVMKVRTVGVAAAFLVPRTRALSDELDLAIALRSGKWTRAPRSLRSAEAFVAAHHGVDLADGAEVVGVGVFVAEDAAGDRGDVIFLGEGSLTLSALEEVV